MAVDGSTPDRSRPLPTLQAWPLDIATNRTLADIFTMSVDPNRSDNNMPKATPTQAKRTTRKLPPLKRNVKIVELPGGVLQAQGKPLHGNIKEEPVRR
ncbi:MAG: hypothetical protein AAF730_12155 [Bacteroidota bacterium]